MDIKVIFLLIIIAVLAVWNILLQLKIRGMQPRQVEHPPDSSHSPAPLDPLTELWSAIVEFRDQSLIYICPIEETDPHKIEEEKGKREKELSSAIKTLKQTIDQNKNSYSEDVVTKVRDILSFAQTILIPLEEGTKYQNLCQSYQNIHQLTLEINRLVQDRMGGG